MSFRAWSAESPVYRHASATLTSDAEIRTIDYMWRSGQLLLFCCLALCLPHAGGQPFDLAGPKVDVHVKRGEVTLPISEVPNLLPGDRLWVHPDLPEDQATHFVLVVAFLRGSTNPPPADWFTRVETWTHEAREEGVFVTVPADAQQVLLFLAPETGGDFNTLRGAVRGRPGSFVRAAQDLQAASWERMRLDAYLADVKATGRIDPAALKTRTELVARSLGIKINENCFMKPADQQASCLSQISEGMVLDDTNAQSLVIQLTNGSTLDLMNKLSSTTFAGGGAYSPYIGAIVDTARILDSLHTAHFQYIPALALPTKDTLNLRLNMPPSFRNPKSVFVVAMPPIGHLPAEPLHPVDPNAVFCALKPGLVLPAEGAPLFFATALAHNLVLHIESRSDPKAEAVDVPVVADPTRGGLVPTTDIKTLPAGDLTAVIRGKWGFDDWTGPQYDLTVAQPGKWTLSPSDQSALVVGRDDLLHFTGESTVCVDHVEAQLGMDHPIPIAWNSPRPDTLEVTVPLRDAEPGAASINVYQVGLVKPDRIPMVAYAAAASLDNLSIRSGDTTALLKGTRLDEVAKAQIHSLTFTPIALHRIENFDQLLMNATDSTFNLEPGKPYTAWVQLKDGRTLKAPVTVAPPRPQLALLSKGVQQDAEAAPQPVQFGGADDLPVDNRLVFFIESKIPQVFPRDEKVEIAGEDTNFTATLSLNDGSLMLEDAHTAVASFDPLDKFGPSAFGPVHLRAIAADGATGDWVPLGRFVRIPGFKDLRCPRAATKPCLLGGSQLFLAAAFSSTPAFDNPVDVPPQFTGTQLVVPHPVNGILYIKLRDDPSAIQTLTLPVTVLSQSASKAASVEAQSGAVPARTPTAAPAAPPAQTAPAQPEAPGKN